MANGMGGLDWSGLPLALDIFGGGADIERIVLLIDAIRHHRPDQPTET